MSEIKEYSIKIEIDNDSGRTAEDDIYGDDLETLKAALPKTIAQMCRENGIWGKIYVKTEITEDDELIEESGKNMYVENNNLWTVEPMVYKMTAGYDYPEKFIQITPENIKRAMCIRSSIITGYPNPCAYTDRYQEEYNVLAVYLAVHYPKRVRSMILTNTFPYVCTSFRRSIELMRECCGQLDPVTFTRLGQWIIFAQSFQETDEAYMLACEYADLNDPYPMPAYAYKAQCNVRMHRP